MDTFYRILQLFAFVNLFISSLSLQENYQEELVIVPLANDFISATFKFVTRRRGATLGGHYDLFPKAIGEIVQKYSVDEFHLSLSQNFWRTDQWGYQPPPSVPTGAQLWAWFNKNKSADVDTQWRDLVHALSGLFCASFSQIDTRRLTIQPKYEFRPHGVLDENQMNDNRFLRYAVLPGDNICTENLTPWKKLLPCKSRAGISTLLTVSTKLFSSNYFSMGVDVRRICASSKCVGENVDWEIVQTLTLVFDSTHSGASDEWSFQSLFGTHVNKQCDVADSSSVFIDVHNRAPQLSPPGFKDIVIYGNRHHFSVYDVNTSIDEHGFLNVGASYKSLKPTAGHPPSIYIHSYIADSGHQSGRLISRLFNNLDVLVPVLYSHSIPWFLRIYYHTLSVVCGGAAVKPRFTFYQPARDRKRSHYLEIAFDLPPTRGGACELIIKFDRQLLRYGEYPPDAHHGFPIPAPMMSFHNPAIGNYTLPLDTSHRLIRSLSDSIKENQKSVWKSIFTVVYGESLLINLPTPDFSMPYNVICLVCTVVALAFGPIHSLTTKRCNLAFRVISCSLLFSLTIADKSKIKKNKILAKLEERFGPMINKFRRKPVAGTDGDGTDSTSTEKGNSILRSLLKKFQDRGASDTKKKD